MAENNDINGAQQQSSGEAGRDSRGRFTKNNPGGPGNPFARQTARLRQVMLDEVSEDDLRDIVKALKQRAREGDTAAAKLVLTYCIGRPAAAVDPDSLDVQEVKHYQEQAVDPTMMQTLIRRVPADLACVLLEVGIEAARRTMTGHLDEQMRQRFPQDYQEEPQPAQEQAAKPHQAPAKPKTPDQDRPAGGKPGRGEKPGKRPAADVKPLPLEEIANAPRTVLAELGLPVPPLTAVGAGGEHARAATDNKRDLSERRCANDARSAPVVPGPRGGPGGALDGGGP